MSGNKLGVESGGKQAMPYCALISRITAILGCVSFGKSSIEKPYNALKLPVVVGTFCTYSNYPPTLRALMYGWMDALSYV